MHNKLLRSFTVGGGVVITITCVLVCKCSKYNYVVQLQNISYNTREYY